MKKCSNVSALFAIISKTLTGELSPALDATFQETHELVGEHWEGCSKNSQRCKKYSS